MKLLTKPRILLMLLMLTCTAARAQVLQATLSHFSTEDGLSSNAIADIKQDDYGFLWLSTWNGLSRFDGYNFYNYRTGNGSHIPNLHNRVNQLCIDNAQNVWLRMYDGHVFVVNRLKDCIVDPLEGVNAHEEFRTSRPLMTTSSGDVMAYFDGVGLYRMHLDRNGLSQQLITTGGYEVTSMAEGYQNDIWVGTNEGVHRINMSNLSVERKAFFAEEHINCIFSNGYNVYAGTESGKIVTFAYGQPPSVVKQGSYPVMSLLVDSQGLIWYADSRSGASRYNPATGDDKLFTQVVPVQEYDGYGGVFHEAMGTVWVRMNHGGYGYYNRETDEVEYFHNDPSNPWNLSNTVNASIELDEGVVWLSTSRRGLEKLEILKNTIGRTKPVPGGSPLDNEVRAMCYDARTKTTLIGNKSGQLFVTRADGSQLVITHDSNGNPLGRLYGIHAGRNGTYWICSKDNGLFRMTPNGVTYNIRNYRHDNNDKWSLNSNSAYAAVEDKDGHVWVATYGGGVNVLTRNKEGREVFLHPNNTMRGYPLNSYHKVRSVAIDKNGHVWAGTTDGILILSMQKGDVKLEKMRNSTEQPDNILMSNDIVYMACDKGGTMWVGTNGGGLSRTIGQDSKRNWLFESFTSEQGLPSEEIKAVTFDERGNVWFSTDHVLCSFNVEKGIFSTFSSLDGVDETMCSEGAAITLGNGNVLFGTLDGYYVVDRTKLTNSTGSMLKLRITDFFQNNVLQSPRLTDDFKNYIPDARSVRLASHNTEFAFRFASLNYQLQHRVHYQYMLEGYDRGWRTADKSRTADYSGVPSGTYRFKVKAFLLESPDKYDLRTIEVTVPPYFFLSSIAIWFYMALAGGLALWLMFWRQRQLERQYRQTPQDDPEPEPKADENHKNSERQEEITDDYVIIE